MGCLNFIHFSLIILSLSMATKCATISPSPIKAAYWPSWDLESFPPSSINTSLFTHIYYAFLMPSNVSFELEISNATATALSNFTTTLRQNNPPVKTLVSIGGGGSDSKLFALIASNTSLSQIFVTSTIRVAREFGLDGIDLDWEFPENPKEMEDLGRLFQQWKDEIKKEAMTAARPPLLLTAAVYYSVEFLINGGPRAYPVASINENLNWVSPMCFDYHGSWDTSATGAHAAFFDPNTNLSSLYGLTSWIAAGVPPYKLVMGLPLYGKTWELKDPKINGVGAPAIGVGPGENGILTYAQVEEFKRTHGATVEYDVDTMSAYSVVNSSWIGYDDPISVTTKIGFAQALGLRGYFFWAVTQDSDWKVTTQASRMWIIHK